MGIQNFPAALQPIIQQNFLAREFEDGLTSILAYRQVAEREPFPNQIGETVTKTRPGLKAPVETPMNPANNTNLDNGLTATAWTVEQYTLSINMYGDSIDLNTVTQRVGIANQFLENAKKNGIQAGQSLDRLARNALFDAYMGGNTRVTATLGAPAATINVDDVRGFLNVFVNGQLTAVSGSHTVPVLVGSDTYNLSAVAIDGTNVSTAPRGISGTLTFTTNVTVADGTAGNAVVSSIGPAVLRPGAKATTAALATSDMFTMGLVLDGVAQLRKNAVPAINGMYNCYLDPVSGRQIFADPDFKQLFQGQDAAKEFRQGRVIELVDVRFIPTTEAFVQKLGAVTIHRPVIVGEGALIEGDFENPVPMIPDGEQSLINVIDEVVHVTREPLDRLKQIIAQSWCWIGGFCAPTDQTINPTVVPTATASYWKRAVVLEHGGNS